MAQHTKRKKKGSERAVSRAEVESSRWHATWSRLSEPVQHLVCLLFLLIVSFGFYAPIHFSDRTLVAGDIEGWRAMADDVIEYREQTGEEALWAPNAFAGMPAYKISQPLGVPQLDDIPRLLRSIIWPSSHFIFLLLGVYFFIVFLTKNKLAGVLAAVAYGLTTYIQLLLIAGHNTKYVALAFAPWLALAFAYVLRKPKLLSGLLFAIALAINIRAGHEQITYYMAFLLGTWWIVEAVGSFKKKQVRSFAFATGFLVMGAVLALLMVAEPFLTLYEYKAYTIRGSAPGEGDGGLGWAYAMNWSQGFGELVTLIIAHAYGGGGATYWGPKPFTAGPHYVGGIVVLLAILAIWRVHRNVVWGLGIATLLMILFSLGEYFAGLNRLMFEYFPLFNAFRVPETWLSIVAFTLACLAALGLSYAVVRESESDSEQQKNRSIYIVTGAVFTFVLLLLLGGTTLFDFERTGEQEQLEQQVAMSNNVAPTDPRVGQAVQQFLSEVKMQRAEEFRGDALRTLIFVALAGLLLILMRRGSLPFWVGQIGLVLLVLIDLWGVDRRYLNEERLVRAAAVDEQIATYDFDRYLLDQGGGERGRFRVLSLEGDPQTTARPSYFYESLGGYHGAKLSLYQDFLDQLLFSETGLPNENALDLLNTRYIIARQPLPGLNPVYQSETGFVVLENQDVLPRAFFVGEIEVVESREAMWERIQSGTFDPEETALLTESIEFRTTPLDSGSVASVTLENYSPRDITWQVETDAPRLLVVSEIYYPAGWEAFIDGEEIPIYRADYLLRAVPIPAGNHTLTMRFDPPTHRIGYWTSVLSTFLVYGLAVLLIGMSFYRKRSTSQVETLDSRKQP